MESLERSIEKLGSFCWLNGLRSFSSLKEPYIPILLPFPVCPPPLYSPPSANGRELGFRFGLTRISSRLISPSDGGVTMSVRLPVLGPHRPNWRTMKSTSKDLASTSDIFFPPELQLHYMPLSVYPRHTYDYDSTFAVWHLTRISRPLYIFGRKILRMLPVEYYSSLLFFLFSS